MKLAIDIGNSRAKFAVFEGNDILFSGESSHDELRNELHNLALKHPKLNKGIVADVTKRGASLLANWEIFPLFYLNHQSKLPITINYLTPQSLGIDRIALASAGRNLFPHSNILIIDAGSCITFDFLDANHSFLGGSISPGISMRYRALNDYTAALPRLKPQRPKNLVGKSTSQAIHQGVVGGVIAEIENQIKRFKKEYENLTVILTGGDAEFLFKQLKSGIFVRQNFLLEGLNAILDQNS